MNQAADKDKDSKSTMMTNLPSNLDEDDIALPLSLIKGLRRKNLDPSMTSTNEMDSSTSSNNTSDKDDSGGDEEGGSNTSSTSKNNEMGGTLSVGQISSLSGSEPEGNRDRVGILRVGGNNTTTGFTSSSDENITGDDELSEKVVVRGKSVTSSQQEQQVQYKVSFAEGHCLKSTKNGISDDGEEMNSSSKRKRNQEKSSTDEDENVKKGKTATEEPQSHSTPFQVSDSSANEGNIRSNGNGLHQQQKQQNGGISRGTSYQSSTAGSSITGSNGQAPGQPSSPSPHSDPLFSSLPPSSKNDSSTSTIAQAPSSPSKDQNIHGSEERRIERNQREKERSNKIASQVDTLRCLLQRGGLFIPKKTKSSVLSEASNYIKTLQDRQQMMNMEMENLKCQLVTAIAARGQQQIMAKPEGQSGDVETEAYQLIFNNGMAGMCVSSMGGALLDW